MISVTIRRREGRIYGFTVAEHGRNDICAAVSLLALNTVNSIEALTEEDFNYEYNPEGGFLQWERKGANPDADLLLEAMVLGLTSVKENYDESIKLVTEVNYD